MDDPHSTKCYMESNHNGAAEERNLHALAISYAMLAVDFQLAHKVHETRRDEAPGSSCVSNAFRARENTGHRHNNNSHKSKAWKTCWKIKIWRRLVKLALINNYEANGIIDINSSYLPQFHELVLFFVNCFFYPNYICKAVKLNLSGDININKQMWPMPFDMYNDLTAFAFVVDSWDLHFKNWSIYFLSGNTHSHAEIKGSTV